MRSKATLALWSLVLPLFAACGGRTLLTIPQFSGGGLLQGAAALPAGALAKLAANYQVGEGSERFGGRVTTKVTGGELAVFGRSTYGVFRAGCLESGTKLVLEGYWRANTNQELGLARFYVSPAPLAAALCAGTDTSALAKPTLLGAMGNGADEALSAQAGFNYEKGIVDVTGKFSIIAHHGVCRTIDECGYSENSLESLRRIEVLGADKVEIDIRVTSDGVPILFHDVDFNQRLVDGQYCHGDVEGMPFAAIKSYCRLVYGERIPTLDEALTAIVNETTLRGVWLDMKVPGAVGLAAAAITRAQALATSKGRTVEIFIGLPDAETIAAYEKDAAGTPCLVEESADDVTRLGCAHWGPRFTRGTLLSNVQALQKAGKSVYFWTVNDDTLIDLFMSTVHADAMITDRAGLTYYRAQLDAAALLAGGGS